jgi:hypothetical protein
MIMNKFYVAAFAVLLAVLGGYATNAAARCLGTGETNSVEFSREVIRKLGIDGKACFQSNGKAYCLSRTAERPTPITVDDVSGDDRLRTLRGLHLCALTAGSLGSCVPA